MILRAWLTLSLIGALSCVVGQHCRGGAAGLCFAMNSGSPRQIGPMSNIATSGLYPLTICIIAHQDDWQLFFMPHMFDAVRDSSMGLGKVVFIYVAAGTHTVTDWNRVEMRQLGAIYSTVFLANAGNFPLNPKTVIGTLNTTEILDHPVHTYVCRNTTSYYMQVMTPCKESLIMMYEGTTSCPIMAMHNQTSYRDWADIANTVATIVKDEMRSADTKGATIVTYSNNASSSHYEHVAIGQMVVNISGSDILKDYSFETIMYDAKYNATLRPEYPLSIADTINQAMVYGALSTGMVYSGHTWAESGADASHVSLMGIKYNRTVYSSRAGIPDLSWSSELPKPLDGSCTK